MKLLRVDQKAILKDDKSLKKPKHYELDFLLNNKTVIYIRKKLNFA